MHNLRHFYYQNKEKIWKSIGVIVFILGIIYYLNYLVGKENSENFNTLGNAEGSVYENQDNQTYISDKSAIFGEKVTENEVEKINNTISKFLQYCKNGNTQEAYNMISEDCKQNQYNTLEKFEQRYIKTKFTNADVYEIENWISDTYKITISEDILATGNINGEKQIEYITIVKEDSIEKLNVNEYIGKYEINKTVTDNEIRITVVNQKVYLDYEEYEFKIENLSNKTIKLDSLDNTGTMYLETTAGVKYNSYSHELYPEDLEIISKNTANIAIKFARPYSKDTNIKNIIFENIILNYPEYKMTKDKSAYTDILKYKIKL